MRIALITKMFEVGGGLENIYQIVKGLPEIEFAVFANGGDISEKFDGLNNVVTYINGYSPENVFNFKPDLIHIHSLKPLLEFYKNPLISYEVPVLFTAHGLHLHKFEFMNGTMNSVKYLLRLNLEKYLFKKAKTIITVSLDDRKFIKKKYKCENVIYVPLGINFSKIKEIELSKSELRRDLNLPEHAFIFLTVARFDFQKGYDVLINAISLIKDNIKNKNIKFALVGDGALLGETKILVNKFAISDFVIFMGKRHDVYHIMKASDTFILPSRWEGLPIALIEAGYCKLPSIASDTYGNREVIDDEKIGMLFKNEDAAALSNLILDVVNGKYNLNEIKENASVAIKRKHCLDKMITMMREIYFQSIDLGI